MTSSSADSGLIVDTMIRLDDSAKARLLSGVFRPDSPSVMFQFPEAAEYEAGDMLGAIIKRVDEQADGLLKVRLDFWDDLARIYATPGSQFDVWYARTVGHGVVLSWLGLAE